MTVTLASSHFVNKDKCPNVPNVLPYAKACQPPLPGLRTRKDIWDICDIWTLVLFDERNPTLKLQSLACRVILPTRPGVQNVLPCAGQAFASSHTEGHLGHLGHRSLLTEGLGAEVTVI